MKTNYPLLILLLLFVTMVVKPDVSAVTIDKKKSAVKNAERQKAYEAAVTALKSQTFLVSLYSFIDKTGRMVTLEPEGNFITVNKDKFMMQKSVSLVLIAFAGTDNFKGEFVDFKLKESKNGNVQISFVLANGVNALTFNGKMSKGDNLFEGSMKGKKEAREIFLSGNVQPVKSRFVY